MTQKLTRESRCVIVSLCENNEHGMETGKCVGAHFSDSVNYDTPPILELDTGYVDEDDELDGPSCERIGNLLLVGGSPFEIRHFRSHVGNIHWNGYVLPLPEARKLATELTTLHGFTVDALTEGQPFMAVSEKLR